MMNSSAKLIFINFILLTTCLGNVWCKVHVVIQNDLPAGTTLSVHCKSKQDDLGVQHITSSWEFSFKPNFWGATLFFCSFSWPGQFHWFDISDQDRDEGDCNKCIWRIRSDRPCRFDGPTGVYDICYPWKLPSQLGRKVKDDVLNLYEYNLN
ncbi:hypothetical protein BT93_L4557 [Corymbia citriodora subsp. variegata]|uniref:S-protein homolog n=1 Tax=Corymbia citriodora subsp. variegata TaxID=360336 RepID=A0A8T0CXM5_CORYI|nr:hypothetical protein BT93_L4557 [Corymbia citriodora subsp. variegata]